MEKKNKCVCVPTANDYMYQHAPRLSVLADQRCKCCTTDEEQHRHTGLACSVSWSYLFIFLHNYRVNVRTRWIWIISRLFGDYSALNVCNLTTLAYVSSS